MLVSSDAMATDTMHTKRPFLVPVDPPSPESGMATHFQRHQLACCRHALPVMRTSIPSTSMRLSTPWIGIEPVMHCRSYSYILVTFARSGAGLLQAEALHETFWPNTIMIWDARATLLCSRPYSPGNTRCHASKNNLTSPPWSPSSPTPAQEVASPSHLPMLLRCAPPMEPATTHTISDCWVQ